jgi:hypothetical protein
MENVEAFLAEIRESHQCPDSLNKLHTWELIMLIVLMVFGMLFNGFVLVTFIHLRKIRNFTNHFVASLALADMLMVIFSPVLFILLFLEKIDIRTGETVRFNSKIFCSLASMLSFACISVDRMLAIAKPLYHRTLPRSCCVKIIGFIWIFSIIATFLDHILSDLVSIFIITYLNFVVAFAIPTMITIASYAIIAKVVLGRRKGDLQAAHHDGQNRRHTLRITGKISAVILPGILMWSIYWIPTFIEVAHGHDEEIFSHSFKEAVSLIPDLTALVNPLIFIGMTSDFRNYLIKSVCRRT